MPKFDDNHYRGVNVPTIWAMTSKGAGGRKCVSVLLADPKRTLPADVMAYQNPDVVARIAKEVKVGGVEAVGIFDDVKRFLYLSAHAKHDMIPTPTIDEGWHAFVLFTEDYERFCFDHFGSFIHHSPHREHEPAAERTVLVPTIDAMHAHFGGIPSQNWHYHAV